MEEKRINPSKSEQELYEMKDINLFIHNERRKDELDRLYEVKQQKKVWRSTVLAAGTILVVLLALAYYSFRQEMGV